MEHSDLLSVRRKHNEKNVKWHVRTFLIINGILFIK